jgi:hypothetical protein
VLQPKWLQYSFAHPTTQLRFARRPILLEGGSPHDRR